MARLQGSRHAKLPALKCRVTPCCCSGLVNGWDLSRLDAVGEHPSRAGVRQGGVRGRVVSGTSLVAVLATAAVGASTYWGSGAVEPSAAALIAAPAVVAAPFGAYLATHLNARVLPPPVMRSAQRAAHRHVAVLCT